MRTATAARPPVMDGATGISVLRLSGRVDLEVVDALARLRLAARRTGCVLVLGPVAEDLQALLALTGLSQAVLEPGGQAEAREERLGVQEVVDVDDPPG